MFDPTDAAHVGRLQTDERWKTCTRCDKRALASPTPERTGFYPNHRLTALRGVQSYDSWCTTCRLQNARQWADEHRDRVNEARREAHKRKMATDPEYREKKRQQTRDSKRRRAQDPEVRARVNANARRYRERVLSDPERAAEWREKRRIDDALRREKRTGSLARKKEQRTEPVAKEKVPRRLPVEPFAEWLTIVKAREVDDAPNARSAADDGTSLTDRTVYSLAANLGISDKRVREVLSGRQANVYFDTVDTALTRYGKPVTVNGFGPVDSITDLYPALAD